MRTNLHPAARGNRRLPLAELISTLLIACCVLIGGRAVLAELAHFAGPASFVLFAIAVMQGAAIVRSLRKKDPAARLAASRDITAFIAALFAVVAVLTRASWSIGSAITATEFVFVLEIMRMLTIAQIDR